MKPWLRMYRAERGSFAQLPLVARGIAMEILKLTDDQGVIPIGSKTPVDAIAFALGATRADRRALAQYVPMLLADGFLIHDGQHLVVPNFPRFQSDDGPTKRPRPNNETATTEQRTDHEPTTTAPRPSNETEGKSAESFVGTERALIREEKREDKRRGEERARVRATPPPSPGTEAFLRSLAPAPTQSGAVVEVLSRTRQAAGGAPFVPSSHADRDAVARLGEWSAAMPPGSLERAASAFWSAKGAGASLRWLADEDPARWLGGTPTRAKRSEFRACPPREAFEDNTAEFFAATGGEP